MAAGTVALSAQTLQVDVPAPALKGEGALLDAEDCGVARDDGHGGVADGGVAAGCVAIIGDGGGFKEGFAGVRCVSFRGYLGR